MPNGWAARAGAAFFFFALTAPLTAQDRSLAQLPPAEDPSALGVLTLTVDEAMALFLKQNLDLLIAQYQIDAAKGREVTARLFPNPVLSVEGTGTAKSESQRRVGGIDTAVSQLFELAGKRGYRMESTRYGTQSTEAAFADAIRILGFAVKDSFYRVLHAQQKIELAQDNSTRFDEILRVNTLRFQKGVVAEVDLIRLQVQAVNFEAAVITAAKDLLTAQNTLKGLLGVRPPLELALTGELKYKPQVLFLESLRGEALAMRPDLLGQERTLSQRNAELKLARALRFPDVTLGAEVLAQGPEGSDTPHKVDIEVSVPLPLFNRNQGGILQAEASLRGAQADLDKTRLQVTLEVETAYRAFIQTQALVQTYRREALDKASTSREITKKAYALKAATILDVLEAFRSYNTIVLGYLDALLAYQHSLLEIDAAVGREVTK